MENNFMLEKFVLSGLDENPALAGLGAAQKEAIRQAVTAHVSQSNIRLSQLPPAAVRFMTRQDLLTPAQQTMIGAKEVRPAAFHRYRIIKLEGGALQNLFKEEQKKLVGVSNIKDDVLEAKEMGLIHELGISFANDPTSTVTVETAHTLHFSSFNITNAAIKSAEFNISLGGKALLVDQPMKPYICDDPGAAPVSLNRDRFMVRMPQDNILWDDKTKMEFLLSFPSGAVLPTGYNFIRLDFILGGFIA